MTPTHAIHGTTDRICVRHTKRLKAGESCPLCRPPSRPATNVGVGVAKARRPKAGAMAEIAMRRILNDLGFVAIECAPANLTIEFVYVSEFTFAPHERNWRVDFCLVTPRIAVEVDGGSHAAGKAKQRTDTEKRGELAARGYRVVAVTPEEIQDGTARDRVVRALEAK